MLKSQGSRKFLWAISTDLEILNLTKKKNPPKFRMCSWFSAAGLGSWRWILSPPDTHRQTIQPHHLRCPEPSRSGQLLARLWASGPLGRGCQRVSMKGWVWRRGGGPIPQRIPPPPPSAHLCGKGNLILKIELGRDEGMFRGRVWAWGRGWAWRS